MPNVIWVGVGGCLGAMARYLTSLSVLRWMPSTWLPVGTLAVNLAGCLLIGVLSRLVQSQSWFSDSLRCLLITGLLGGFTTFSSFGLETFELLRQRRVTEALLYVAVSCLWGVLAVWLGAFVVGQRG